MLLSEFGKLNTTHIFASIVADVEHLGIESQPIEIPVYLLADIGLPPGRHYIDSLLHPTMPMIIF